MDLQKFYDNVLKDLKVELKDEFDRNFQRKAFFDKAWPKNKLINQRGSMMMRNGHLRNSIESRIQGDKIIFSSSLPYASIHNEGGEITVTPKMKSYFWAMYYKTSGGMSKRKDGTASRNQRNQRLSIEAMQWKNLALMKVGQKLTIPERKFIGHHPQVNKMVKDVVGENLKGILEQIKQKK